MSHYFTQGFSVRDSMWHKLGETLDEYPGREVGMVKAGHDFEVIEHHVLLGRPISEPSGRFEVGHTMQSFKALVNSKNGAQYHVPKEGFGVVQNSVGWDIVDAMVGNDPNIRYETGLTLKDGAVCVVLAWLDEPVTIPGDNSQILPWVCVSWVHDGSGSVKARSTSIRTVCWNTFSAAEAQGLRNDTEFTFRHTRNVMERIEEAKLAIRGIRPAHEEYVELARDLAEIEVTEEQRKVFVEQMIPMPDEALISNRVKGNIESARADLRSLFSSETIPEAHRFTGYGLHLAGGEYLDHIRPFRTPETKFGRSLLRREPAKAKLTKLIREVAKA
jgi:phage/plasmid-like protein (TIGR03299 family)